MNAEQACCFAGNRIKVPIADNMPIVINILMVYQAQEHRTEPVSLNKLDNQVPQAGVPEACPPDGGRGAIGTNARKQAEQQELLP